MKLLLNKYSFYLFIIGFIIFTVVGTISHEFGHIIIADRLGYGTTLHFGSMNWNENNGWDVLKSISSEYNYEIKNNLPFNKKDLYENIIKKLNSDSLIISLGGVLLTILIGSIAFLLLLFNLRVIKKNGLNTYYWLLIFLSLFWLREVFNVIISLLSAILHFNHNYFSGDETEISKGLNLPAGTFSIILGIVGVIISLIVVFRIIPKSTRFTFILSGIIGGTLGFFLWMKIVGPIILP